MMKVIIIAVLVVGGIIWFASNQSQTDQANILQENAVLQGEEIPTLGRNHVPEGTKVMDYNSNPPTSGNHWPQPANWGIYLSPLPDEQLVHNLEHGGIWISHKDLDDDAIIKLGALVKKYPQAVIITPRAENESRIALVSWGRLDTFDVLDIERVERFIKSNINNSPEKVASLEQPAVAVGGLFPDFSVTEVDGRTITNESLKGKPAIVWFTTEFCVPCQIGAREVSKLDDELGGSAFEVLVIFVDSRETNEDLVSWRNRFARDDWMVAFDSFDDGPDSLSARVGLKYLDSKYLLDKSGVIRDIDFQIADESYLNIIRQAVRTNQ